MPSTLQILRTTYTPTLPEILSDLHAVNFVEEGVLKELSPGLNKLFPKLSNQKKQVLKKGSLKGSLLKVGCVFSGGQAAGGHNVIAGLLYALKKLNPQNSLIGFKDGPSGILEANFIAITENTIKAYLNQGGFDLLGSGRTKIETEEQFEHAAQTVQVLQLDGLVIIGGDDSNTNAALLAEYFLKKGIKTKVVGIPKTIDGDLKNEEIEISFGFDSATKTYAEIIGNTLTDSLSAKKYTFFVRLMGRSASHIALQCALYTQPNLTLISEEVEAQNKTIQDITNEITDLILERASQGKNYGAILLPEGVIEFIPECKMLIKELNTLLSPDQKYLLELEKIQKPAEKIEYIQNHLQESSKKCLLSLPEKIQQQLLLDRDPHGNVQVSQIDTERLFIETVKNEIKRRGVKIKFSPIPMFCGYEGRSCLPSNFDANYCYSLGIVATLILQSGLTGYMACLQNLKNPVEEWKAAAVPLVSMMTIEKRSGKDKPVIKKALVDLSGTLFRKFNEKRLDWKLQDCYQNPGPIQFFGPKELIDTYPEME